MRKRRTIVLALAAALGACATDTGADGTDPDREVSVASVEDTTKVTTGAPLGATLRELDSRVDRYVWMQSQPGEEARADLGLLDATLKAQVAQNLPLLLQVLQEPSNAGRRVIAAKSLAFSTDPSAEEALMAVLDPERTDVRLLTAATFSLSRIARATTPTDPLLTLLLFPDPDVRVNVLLTLWHVFGARRDAGASALDPVDQERALPLLHTSLFDPDDGYVRAYAAAALGAIGDPRSVQPLVSRVRDEHVLARTQAALALGKIADPSAIMPLVDILDETPAGTPKAAVVLALTAILERNGRSVPNHIGDSEVRWREFVKERFGPPGQPLPDVGPLDLR